MRKKITLIPDGIKYVPEGWIVDSEKLYYCIAVFIYNESKREAFAGNFGCPSVCELEDIIKEAIQTFDCSEKVKVYVLGDSIYIDDSKEDLRKHFEERKYVKDLLEKRMPIATQINIMWCPDNTYARLRLNLKSGKETVEIYDFASDRLLYKGPILPPKTN